MVKVDNEIGLLLVFAIYNKAYPIAYIWMSDDVLPLAGINNVVGDRISSLAGKEYQNGIRATVTGQAVECRITFNIGAETYRFFWLLFLFGSASRKKNEDGGYK